MPCTLPEALRLKAEGFPQDGTALVWVRRLGDGSLMRWTLECRPDRMADLEAHTLGSFLNAGFPVDWAAAPEAEEIEAARKP